MPKPNKCSHCQKPATIHLSQIADGKILNVDLCEDCPLAADLTKPSAFSLAESIIQTSSSPDPSRETLRCEQCGFTQTDFISHGRFGCPQCYKTFGSMVEPMLCNLHKGTRHIGKTPWVALDRKSLYERLTTLESFLDEAIEAERYEDAVRLRDEINQVKQTAGQKFGA